ncbi:extracellular solute-binding protein [Propionibacteriaceae bacterium Y2011]|uniref:extracellular solute-binding protein n=1 Tax=Microlunatus sp. Y2014 TaxID=3418488 RepID=UPI003B44D6A4
MNRSFLTERTISRRHLVGLAGAAATVATVAACTPPEQGGGGGPAANPDEVPEKPSAPVTIHILDVAGNLRMSQPMLDQFVKDHSDVVSEFTTETGGAPDLVGTLKPQVDSGNLQIELVFSGTDGMSAGLVDDLWVPVVKEFSDRLGNMQNYLEDAQESAELAGDFGVMNAWTPSGPFIQYNPEHVPEVPKSAEEALAWAKANTGKFGYPRPANSGVGRTWLQGLPYMLGDSDPLDPEAGWDNTWAYLADLGSAIANYPTGTGQAVQAMADGTWWMMPMTFGWDMGPRSFGTAPLTLETAPLDNTTYVCDSQYALMPRGLSADKQSAVLLFMNYMLQPEVNAAAFDEGYFYPGPAVQGATLEMAPQASQESVNKFRRDWYDDAIANTPVKVPLDPEPLIAAFDKWDRDIGAGKTQG